jgi:hypothetical protein
MLVGLALMAFDGIATQTNKLGANDAGSSNVIGVIISTIILLYVAIILVGQFQVQADDMMNSDDLANNTEAQAAYSNTQTSGWGAINLMGMYPYILGAVAILGVVVMIAR